MKHLFQVIGHCLLCTLAAANTDTLVTANAVWRYLDDGSDQGKAWRNMSYDDSAWPAGAAQLGYGDGDEATVVSYGSSTGHKYITTYFRKTLFIADPGKYTSLELLLLRDDGAKVFVNGIFAAKSNMPNGKVTYNTLAKKGQGAATENKFYRFNLSPSLLVVGTNLIAVEIHQAKATSNDLGFALQLIGTYADCEIPSGQVSSNVSNSQALLGWDPVTGASSYDVRYRSLGGTWTTWPSAGNSASVPGLNQATTYEWQVRAVCPYSTGAWSASSSFTTLPNLGPPDSLIVKNDSWKFLDDGSNQGTAWKEAWFDDSSWDSGNAELGYGDGDENTVVSFGPNASAKFITTYFRKSFTVADPTVFAGLSLQLVRDDGAVVYLNGTEVYRSNMPGGTVSSTTLALAAISGSGESAWDTQLLAPGPLVAGDNVLAVEIHQISGTSSDISFHLTLTGINDAAPILTRGPYLQMVTPTSIHVRWQTDQPADSRVRYGTGMDYANVVDSSTAGTEHEIKLSGLIPGTLYFYTIGSTTVDLQGDPGNHFITSLPVGSTDPFRVWVTGDFGNGSTEQAQVRDAYLNYAGDNPANLWIWLGDNAYESGTVSEFDNNVFSMYPAIFRNTPLYPAIGNHDYANAGYQSSSALGYNFPYFDLFTCPQNAEAGGMASGTEKYYSYNYGNAHFIALDSYGALNLPGSPMYAWLEADLAANAQQWIVAYWHHPPYSMGSHNSDTGVELVNVRQHLVPLLESYHADLVLCGHSHVYERSVLLDGHYGTENTLAPVMVIDSSDGRSPSYFKLSGTSRGTVYAVCGISGKGASASVQASWPHDAMYAYSHAIYGSMLLDFDEDTLTARLVTSTGVVFDEFKIEKSGGAGPPPATPTEVRNDEDLLVYPNPFDDELVLRFYLASDSPVRLEISDLDGKIIYANNPTIRLRSGFHEIVLSKDDLANPSRFLVLRLVTGSQAMVKRISRN